MKSVRNAIRCLQLFSEEASTVTVSQVSEFLGIPKSSASRMLAALREGGIVEQEQRGGHYRPGPLVLRLASAYGAGRTVRDVIRKSMRRLAAETRYSCWISALTGREIVVLEGVHGSHPLRLVVEPGTRLPAHASAGGKALLACCDDARVKQHFRSKFLASHASRTIRTVDTLLADLDKTRRRGFAEAREELIDGVISLAVSFAVPGESPLALSVSFPAANVSAEEEAAIRESLLSVADEVGAKLGLPPRAHGTPIEQSQKTGRRRRTA